MLSVVLHFDHGHHFDQMTIRAETLEELKAIADREVAKRKPEAYWSSDFHAINMA